MSLARAQTWNARSGGERTCHEATALPLQYFVNIQISFKKNPKKLHFACLVSEGKPILKVTSTMQSYMTFLAH